LRPFAKGLSRGARRSGAAIRRTAFGLLVLAANRLSRRAEVTVPQAIETGRSAEPVDAEAEAEELAEVPLSGSGSPPDRGLPRREELRRRTYAAASSVNVEAAVRAFLASRIEGVPMESLVRYLDREFGDGLGVGLLESLRARGVVRIQRDRRNPVRLTVRFDPSKAASGPRGG
jgi:hypothetical protein